MAHRGRYHYYDENAESQDEMTNPRPVNILFIKLLQINNHFLYKEI